MTEQREGEIEELIAKLADEKGCDPSEVESALGCFGDEVQDAENTIAGFARRLGISVEELREYIRIQADAYLEREVGDILDSNPEALEDDEEWKKETGRD